MDNKNMLQKKDHEGRPDLTGEHRLGDSGQVVLLVVFMIVWAGDSFFLNLTNQLSGYVSIYDRLVVGFVLLGFALYLSRTGLKIVFGEVNKKPQIIRKGVFNVVRHPIYLGSILVYFGLFAMTLSLASLAIGIAGVLFYHYIARYEEKLLLEKFGQEYQDYIDKVPMWIPWMK